MTADPRCAVPGCGGSTLEFSVRCFEHRPKHPEGIFVPDDLANPSDIEFYPNGQMRRLEWKVDGTLSRSVGPAVVVMDQTGKVQLVEWRQGGVRHRSDGGPAVIRLTSNGWSEDYFRDGLLDREGAPATSRFTEDGLPMAITYHAGPLGRHRTDGPAIVSWYRDGSVTQEKWFVRGEEFSGAAEVAIYVEALADGAPHEWARAFALGEGTS